MHKKSFTFGIGVGILFVTSIFYLILVTFATTSEQITAEEIITLARQMGYIVISEDDYLQYTIPEISQKEQIMLNNYSLENNQQNGEDIAENVYENYENEVLEEIHLDDTELNVIQQQAVSVTHPILQTNPIPPQYYHITDMQVENNQEDTMYVEELNYPPNYEINIEISGTTTVAEISQALYDNNIINDAEGFTQFIINGGYSTQLSTGNLIFHTNSTFEEVIRTLTE